MHVCSLPAGVRRVRRVHRRSRLRVAMEPSWIIPRGRRKKNVAVVVVVVKAGCGSWVTVS